MTRRTALQLLAAAPSTQGCLHPAANSPSIAPSAAPPGIDWSLLLDSDALPDPLGGCCCFHLPPRTEERKQQDIRFLEQLLADALRDRGGRGAVADVCKRARGAPPAKARPFPSWPSIRIGARRQGSASAARSGRPGPLRADPKEMSFQEGKGKKAKREPATLPTSSPRASPREAASRGPQELPGLRPCATRPLAPFADPLGSISAGRRDLGTRSRRPLRSYSYLVRSNQRRRSMGKLQDCSVWV
jgi:hypothetical protein